METEIEKFRHYLKRVLTLVPTLSLPYSQLTALRSNYLGYRQTKRNIGSAEIGLAFVVESGRMEDDDSKINGPRFCLVSGGADSHRDGKGDQTVDSGPSKRRTCRQQ